MTDKRFENLTGEKIHFQFPRNLINYHENFNEILNLLETGERFYFITLYTPTKSSLNLNDINQFMMLKWFQSVFKVPIIIHVTDNHRFLNESINIKEFPDMELVKSAVIEHFPHSFTQTIDEIRKLSAKSVSKLISDQHGQIKDEFKMKFNEILTMKCIRELVAFDFHRERTFICRNLEYIGRGGDYYRSIIELGAKISFVKSQNINRRRGIDASTDVETVSLVAKDAAAVFPRSYPRLFLDPCRDSRPIVVNLSPELHRLSRRLARTIDCLEPILIGTKPLPSLLDSSGSDCEDGVAAMDSSVVNSAIFLSDEEKSVRRKIDRFAFSGGRDTVEEHRRLGANCAVDVALRMMRRFAEDEAEMEAVGRAYGAGEMLTGELKGRAGAVIWGVINALQTRLATVTDAEVEWFMSERLLETERVGGGVGRPRDEARRDSPIEPEETTEFVVEESEPAAGGDIVTPWQVVASGDAGIDYDKLVEKYGSNKIEDALVAEFERVIGTRPHHLLTRGMFYSHRELNEIIDAHDKKKAFFLYTGRGPSSDALHLGHMIPFIFTKWLQDIFNVPLVIQLTDDEKFLMRNISLEDVRRMTRENVKDIIAVGFDPEKTFIFSDFQYIGQEPAFFETSFRVGSKINFNTIRAIFGFNENDSVEKIAFPPTQAAPSFSCSFPAIFHGNPKIRCLIPCAIDQDPYFRMTRDVAPRLNMPKPALVHSRFFPSLQGNQTKMNASNPNSAIFMTDSSEQIANKINNHVFTIPEEKKKGLSVEEIYKYDICYQYLTFFVEDEEKLNSIGHRLGEGSMSNEELKMELISVLTPVVEAHKARREQITEELVDRFMTPRSLNF